MKCHNSWFSQAFPLITAHCKPLSLDMQDPTDKVWATQIASFVGKDLEDDFQMKIGPLFSDSLKIQICFVHFFFLPQTCERERETAENEPPQSSQRSTECDWPHVHYAFTTYTALRASPKAAHRRLMGTQLCLSPQCPGKQGGAGEGGEHWSPSHPGKTAHLQQWGVWPHTHPTVTQQALPVTETPPRLLLTSNSRYSPMRSLPILQLPSKRLTSQPVLAGAWADRNY